MESLSAIPNRSFLAPKVLAAGLANAGVSDVCISPGSRSAPLALAFAGQAGLRCWSHVDERSGAFFALGLARASRRPVAVLCTSGTAAANFLPAVVEAWHARVPLVVLTADRPPELRDCGAGQTIDQNRIFGSHVRWFVEVSIPEPSVEAVRWLRSLAGRAVAEALGPPAGPVHLNVPLREPLVPVVIAGDVPEEVARFATSSQAAFRRADSPRLRADRAAIESAASSLVESRRPILVAGPLDDPDPDLPGAVAALADAIGAPVLAEPASNLRRPALDGRLVEAHEALLRTPHFAESHEFDAVIRLGAPPTSKSLATRLWSRDGVPHVLLDGADGWPDPAAVATHVLRSEPTIACADLACAIRAIRPGEPAADPAWRSSWTGAGECARRTLVEARTGDSFAHEAHVIGALAEVLPAGALLYVGNSLAIRALDWFWPADAPRVRVLANRGANGIDGFASSGLGAAAVSVGPVVGLCGDLTFYHDLNGLMAIRRYGLRVVLVVMNNDGGGIFDYLPVADQPQYYEEFFATPHGLDFRPVVEMYGAAFDRVSSPAAIAGAIRTALRAPGSTVVEVSLDRRLGVAAHRRGWETVRLALEKAT